MACKLLQALFQKNKQEDKYELLKLFEYTDLFMYVLTNNAIGNTEKDYEFQKSFVQVFMLNTC